MFPQSVLIVQKWKTYVQDPKSSVKFLRHSFQNLSLLKQYNLFLDADMRDIQEVNIKVHFR